MHGEDIGRDLTRCTFEHIVIQWCGNHWFQCPLPTFRQWFSWRGSTDCPVIGTNGHGRGLYAVLQTNTLPSHIGLYMNRASDSSCSSTDSLVHETHPGNSVTGGSTSSLSLLTPSGGHNVLPMPSDEHRVSTDAAWSDCSYTRVFSAAVASHGTVCNGIDS